jgi:hypothetical protein
MKILLPCLILMASLVFAESYDKAYFAVSEVTTSTTNEVIEDVSELTGNLKRIIIDNSNTLTNGFNVRLYAENSYSSERTLIYTVDNLTTNSSVMPKYNPTDNTGTSETNEWVEYVLFQDTLTLEIGNATGTNIPARVTVIYESMR